MTLHQIKVKFLCLLGLAIDIHSKGKWPSKALSNLYPHRFKIDGVWCASMEGFLQSLKTTSMTEQKEICRLTGKEAKMFSTDNWKTDQTLYWNGGRGIKRDSAQFQALVRKAYRAMFEQCPEFYEALKATGNKQLFHSIGNPLQNDIILTEKELCDILTELRLEIQIAKIFDKADCKKNDTRTTTR